MFQILLKHVDSWSYIWNQPIKTCQQAFSCNCTTPNYLPVTTAIHYLQIQHLQNDHTHAHIHKWFMYVEYQVTRFRYFDKAMVVND